MLMMRRVSKQIYLFVALSCWIRTCFAFSLTLRRSIDTTICHGVRPFTMKLSDDEVDDIERRKSIGTFIGITTFGFRAPIYAVTTDTTIPTSLKELTPLVRQARSQLSTIPGLIEEAKWDSVRGVLVKPPISDCWSKSSKLLLNLASAIGEELPDGDELAALEAREDAASHLRYLDMAVYNNNFNPIATEGETGATKELIRSYYEDPKNELDASIKALDELVNMLPINQSI